jgi:hypothetical protein
MNDTPESRYQTHLEAIRAQIGPKATAAQLALADRVAALIALCDANEAEFKVKGRMKDETGYVRKVKALQSALISLGVVLNPRTTKTEKGSADDHAAMLD